MNKDIKCKNCDTLFGKEADGLLIKKYRDLYVTIDGKAWGPCRGCGALVKWPEEDRDEK